MNISYGATAQPILLNRSRCPAQPAASNACAGAGVTDLADPLRLAVIDQLGLSGHLADPDLDDILSTVVEACGVPMAAINIVTPGLQTNASERGIDNPFTNVPDAVSFSAGVVRAGEAIAVADATEHALYARNPLVLSGVIRACAGAPFRFQGHIIGALAMFDDSPRSFTRGELEVLASQARLVSAILQLRVLGARARAADQQGASAPSVLRAEGQRSADPQPSSDDDVGELRRAVRDGQLVMHYQPALHLDTGVIEGVEALVRWQHPTRGLLPPVAFVPLAEKSAELMTMLGDWVLRACAEQLTSWQLAGRDLHVAINISPVQLADPDFPHRVSSILADAGTPPDRIVLELTESALLDQPDACASLTALHDLGIRLALDDFGTGYASFSYLRRFPIDILKIDRSFVAGLGRFPDDDAIVSSVAGLARSTGKFAVAEGVETKEQLALVRAFGVKYAQGYLWSPALPAEQLLTWLDNFASANGSSGVACGAPAYHTSRSPTSATPLAS